MATTLIVSPKTLLCWEAVITQLPLMELMVTGQPTLLVERYTQNMVLSFLVLCEPTYYKNLILDTINRTFRKNDNYVIVKKSLRMIIATNWLHKCFLN